MLTHAWGGGGGGGGGGGEHAKLYRTHVNASKKPSPRVNNYRVPWVILNTSPLVIKSLHEIVTIIYNVIYFS